MLLSLFQTFKTTSTSVAPLLKEN